MSVDERFASHAHEWGVTVQDVRTTETSQLGFGTQANRQVVLKVIRREHSEEWRCGDVLEAFGGAGMVLPIAHAPGAVLMPRLVPGHDLSTLCDAGHDDEASEIIASLLQRMSNQAASLEGLGSVERLLPDFERFRGQCDGFIPAAYVDRAETLFAELCATQREQRLLHGDLHHYNVLYDADAGWTVIDPWGAIGEIEFELGPSLRNPIVPLVKSSREVERRLRIYAGRLNFDAGRAVKWAFATTVLGIIWPFEPGVGLDLRAPFASAARAMCELIDRH